MSKLDNVALNTIKCLSIDMINEAKSGNVYEALGSVNIFYSLFLNNLNYLKKDEMYANKDHLVVTNSMLPVLYSTMHLFEMGISLDMLKDYKKLNSSLNGYADSKSLKLDMGSIKSGDVIPTSLGIALGERYLENLLKIENVKSNLINYYTYCVCDYNDLKTSLESIMLASEEGIKKLAIICHIDKGLYKDYKATIKYLKDNDVNVIEVKNGYNFSDVDYEIESIKSNKEFSVIVIYTDVCKEYGKETLKIEYNKPLDENNELIVKNKLGITSRFSVDENIYKELDSTLNKRMSKVKEKYDINLKNNINNLKVKEIIDFASKKSFKTSFNADNLKLNENYYEELYLGNKKVLNVLASKSPFILSISNDFLHTECNIKSAKYMSKLNPLGRNISYKVSISTLGFIASGLSTLGFYTFVSTTLTDSVNLIDSIKLNVMNEYPVYYVFTNDSFTNTYDNLGINPIYELNILRMIPNLITIRPADINEIIGCYDVIASYKKSIALVIGSEKTKKLPTTNYKYVIAGAYPVKIFEEGINAILIASGTEVKYAIDLAEDLVSYGIYLRVVSMPSHELFARQSERYHYGLLPRELKIFILEYGDGTSYLKYTQEDYIFGLNKFSTTGTKEEVTNYYNLNKDYIITKIVEYMKN